MVNPVELVYDNDTGREAESTRDWKMLPQAVGIYGGNPIRLMTPFAPDVFASIGSYTTATDG